MLQPGFVFTSYHITNKTIDGNNATMMVDLFFHLQNATTGEQEGNITADFGFSYETGGWRIWQIPDPETAVAEWIDAVNVRNLNRLYLLSPAQFRKTISWNQFKTANENNSRLQPGYSYTGFSVLDKNVSGESATMRVLIQVQQSSPENSTIMQSFSTMEHFGFTFEDGEWKIWELPW